MWKVTDTVVGEDLERAVRALIATPDRRGPARELIDGVAEVTRGSQRARAVTVDLGEGGLALLCGMRPELGELLCIQISGLVFEGRVRHVEADGALYRIGLESA